MKANLSARLLSIALIGAGAAALGILVTFAEPMFDGLKAQATPAIAKGKPCGNCHKGSPPSKENVRR
jgi:hypothetical protein